MAVVEGIVAKKFFKGFIDPKNALKSIVFGAWLFIIIGAGWSVYVTYIKPHVNPTPVKETTQQAQQITNNEYNYNEPDKNFFVGVKLFGFRLGLSK